jgi:hypothetical protein
LYFTKKWVGQHLGRFFSRTHPGTLLPSHNITSLKMAPFFIRGKNRDTSKDNFGRKSFLGAKKMFVFAIRARHYFQDVNFVRTKLCSNVTLVRIDFVILFYSFFVEQSSTKENTRQIF